MYSYTVNLVIVIENKEMIILVIKIVHFGEGGIYNNLNVTSRTF